MSLPPGFVWTSLRKKNTCNIIPAAVEKNEIKKNACNFFLIIYFKNI